MTFLEQEKRIEIFEKHHWKCKNCGCDVREFTPQLAHLINQSKSNIKMYGKEVIHHEMNLKPACTLFCNQKLSLYGRYNSIKDLIAKIKEELEK